MAERLLSTSRVLLYGREVVDLRVGIPAAPPPPPPPPPPPLEPVPALGVNRLLQNQIGAAGALIARIYGFSYEGHYYDLAKPAMFLVHGAGVPADPPGPHPRASRAPAGTDFSGVAATAKSLADDVMVWAYDKSDLSIRLDTETGTLEQILLDVELSTDRLGLTFSGKNVRLRGTSGGGD